MINLVNLFHEKALAMRVRRDYALGERTAALHWRTLYNVALNHDYWADCAYQYLSRYSECAWNYNDTRFFWMPRLPISIAAY